MSFELLSEPIRKYIRDKRWEELRPIQNAAISRILTTDNNYILASRTASGKTEAAFLPILSKIDFNEKGVQILYISPLIALINDQFNRVEELCQYLEVTVTKWHGEANKSQKEKLIANPRGVVLITPESIEAMFVNKPFNVKHLFSKLKFVVIDEIHSFIGTDRGTHLKSLLSRLQNINQNKFNVIGLSATIGDYTQAKDFTGDAEATKILLDRTAKEIEAKFQFYKEETTDLPLDLLKNLYLETKDNKALIFPNSRGRVEEIAVKLRKISDRVNGHSNYFSHHSSVHKEVREYVEFFAKNNRRENFAISCTSTLELGIDIGSVDKIIQINATNSIASLIQRVGRSGRQNDKSSNLVLYATDKWNLLQSLACWELYKEGFIEPPQTVEKPYDILLHQTLSIVKSTSGIRINTLVSELRNNFAFRQIDVSEIQEIIKHLLNIDLLENLQGQLIIGIEGEKIVNSRYFYSMFSTESNLKVIHAGNTIGEIPLSPQLKEDENIFLAARIWKITDIDLASNKIQVIPAKDGKKPHFSGGGTIVHPKIREKMLEILFSKRSFDVLNEKSSDEIAKLQKDFSIFKIQNIQNERPLLVKKNKLEFFTFGGTKINRSLKLYLDLAEIKNSFDEGSSSFIIDSSMQEFINNWNKRFDLLQTIDVYLENLLSANPTFFRNSKWGLYLPTNYQINLIKQIYFDLAGVQEILKNYKLIQNG